VEGVNTENPVHAFGKRTRTQHLANAQVKVLYLFLYLPSKKNMFFVFFGVGNQGPRGQGQTWGGQLWGVCLRVLLGSPDFGDFAREEKLSRGCLCLKETESSQQCALWRHTPSGQRLSGIMCATALRLGRTCER